MPQSENLFNRVWKLHTVRELPSGQTQLFIGLHLIHEVTSPQAFQMIRERDLSVLFPERTVATADHIVPTESQARPLQDSLAEDMLQSLEKSARDFDIRFFNLGDKRQGIVHVVGPEQGLTQPGMTIACGDSHTATHGAFGAIAFGIGTSQVRDVLATQCIAMAKPKVRRIEINGELGIGVTAKDVILHIIRTLGVNGGVGYAYEYGGDAIDRMTMEERMTICNMSIEGGARAGYVNPDPTTVDYLRGRPFAPKGKDFDVAATHWLSLASPADAQYDDVVKIKAADIPPTVTWGINPGQAIGVTERIPDPKTLQGSERAATLEALAYMKLEGGHPILGTKIDVAFIGSCTNGRLSDLREVTRFVEGRRVAKGVKALVVPGSGLVKEAAEREGLDRIFTQAGFEWREAGCSMCLAMNPDKLVGEELCASSSNRNFKGRQGSPSGRTVLMSPIMVAAAALSGAIADVRAMIKK